MNSPIPVVISDHERLPFRQIDDSYFVNKKSNVHLISGVISDPEKLPFCQVDDSYVVNEKSNIYLINDKEKIDADQQIPESQQGFQSQVFTSFESLMIFITKLMQECTVMVRNVNMKNAEHYIQQRIDEFTKAVSKVIKSIQDMAFIDFALGMGEGVICTIIGANQILFQSVAQILGSGREAFVGMALHSTGAWFKQMPQTEGEIGNKEKGLNDVSHGREQNAQEWFKEASRLLAQLNEMVANFLQQLQPIISVPRH